ncbi:MAG: hypothetical protein CVV30_06265 [Methanomicrobiales archaeon HGW-Methanomicrobiales-1]|jgi:hypothetical protein|nr:MAG: hypothetical protein CVV30_06265 [Methanomicrobiales archaeon HGW-Methanomicrobiales-1]
MENVCLSKQRKIKYKVIKVQNARELARFIYDDYLKILGLYNEAKNAYDLAKEKYLKNEIKKDELDQISYPADKPRISFETIWENNSVNGSNIDIIEGDNLLNKKITSIEITYTRINNGRIHVKLHHHIDCSYNNNYVAVSGSDEVWVNGIFNQINELIDNWQNQDTWIYKNKRFFELFSGLIIGVSSAYILTSLIYFFWPGKNFLLSFGILSFIGLYMSLFIVWPLVSYIEKLYPCIEFFMGPEHAQIEKIKREKIIFIFTIILIPFIISFIFFILSNIRVNP